MSFLRNNDVKKHLERARPHLVPNPTKPNNEATARPSIQPNEENLQQHETKDSSTNSKTV